MLDNFEQEYAKYEAKLFAPFDDERMTEDEYEDMMTTLGESLMEEKWLKEIENNKRKDILKQ